MRPQEASSNSLRRPVIGLFGEMNAGKSTIMNALTQQTTAIVDKTPGTTADVKTALLQMHGLGPCKVRNDRTRGYQGQGPITGTRQRPESSMCDYVAA
jgi:ATPase subunit of ABC transporter with duplicated ATPase domains